MLQHATSPLTLIALSSIALAGCLDEPLATDEAEPAALSGAPLVPLRPGVAVGERRLAPTQLVAATVFHRRLALTSPAVTAGLVPCAFTNDIPLATSRGKRYPALIDPDFRGTGLALIALDKDSDFVGLTVVTPAALVGTQLDLFGSGTALLPTTTTVNVHIALTPREGKYSIPVGSAAGIQVTDNGAPSFDAAGKLVATQRDTRAADAAKFITFDADDTTYAIARALSRCGFRF